MNLLDYDKMLAKRISNRNIQLALLGQSLVAFALGARFSISLVQFGYPMLLVATLIAVVTLNRFFSNWHAHRASSYGQLVLGVSSGALLMLFLGIQSPHIPLNTWWLLLGFTLLLPAIYDVTFKTKTN